MNDGEPLEIFWDAKLSPFGVRLVRVSIGRGSARFSGREPEKERERGGEGEGERELAKKFVVLFAISQTL